MKRIGKKDTLKELKDNCGKIIFYDYVMTNQGGYKLATIDNEIIGYITCDLFYELIKDKLIVKVGRGWATEIYEYNF